MVTLSRAEILATVERLGGIAGVTPLLSLLPGAGPGTSSLVAILQKAENELRAGPVTVTINAPIAGQIDIEFV